jgi:succinate-semialdehyde dehydrogenase/glutarate-semialdehyde dehydrogenase
MGPLQNEGAIAKTERHIRDALDKGARLLGGGDGSGGAGSGRLADRRGHYHVPTALADATSDMLVMHEETFGPLAAFVRFRTEEELLREVNHATYGLTAYCYTRDLARAFRTAAAFRCGFVGVNDRRPQGAEVPMGGVGESGLGREGGHWGIEEFTTIKYVSMRV